MVEHTSQRLHVGVSGIQLINTPPDVSAVGFFIIAFSLR